MRPPSVTAARLEEKTRLRDSVDQHFAATTLRWADDVFKRDALDEKTRYLVLLGQFAMTRSHRHLDDCLRAAIGSGVSPRLALESILMCSLYGGDVVVEPALEIFVRVARELGFLSSLADDQLPIDGRDSTRDLDAEKASWPKDLLDHPLRETLTHKHGELGVSTGLRFRGKHHLEILDFFDSLDTDFANAWEAFGYQNMYSRAIMDDKTRLLCTAGNTLVAHENVQTRNHMKSAMAAGATPKECLDVIFISAVYFGLPMLHFLNTFVELVDEVGRLGELGDEKRIRRPMPGVAMPAKHP
jgi:alkylhydroperoxidase/carboxymuconolactone decarboxylase family protein YurZ